MANIDYSKHIHEFTDKNGKTRYAVCVWVDRANEWQMPMNDREHKLTGCSAYISKAVSGMGGYATRARARYEARRRFFDGGC